MDLIKVYHDSDGVAGNILQIVRREPEWAANRIQVGEVAIEKLAALEPSATPKQQGDTKLLDKEYCVGKLLADKKMGSMQWKFFVKGCREMFDLLMK